MNGRETEQENHDTSHKKGGCCDVRRRVQALRSCWVLGIG
jgi:hypothetical protein